MTDSFRHNRWCMQYLKRQTARELGPKRTKAALKTVRTTRACQNNNAWTLSVHPVKGILNINLNMHTCAHKSEELCSQSTTFYTMSTFVQHHIQHTLTAVTTFLPAYSFKNNDEKMCLEAQVFLVTLISVITGS